MIIRDIPGTVQCPECGSESNRPKPYLNAADSIWNNPKMMETALQMPCLQCMGGLY